MVRREHGEEFQTYREEGFFSEFLELVLPPLREFLRANRLPAVTIEAIVRIAMSHSRDSRSRPQATPDYSHKAGPKSLHSDPKENGHHMMSRALNGKEPKLLDDEHSRTADAPTAGGPSDDQELPDFPADTQPPNAVAYPSAIDGEPSAAEEAGSETASMHVAGEAVAVEDKAKEQEAEDLGEGDEEDEEKTKEDEDEDEDEDVTTPSKRTRKRGIICRSP